MNKRIAKKNFKKALRKMESGRGDGVTVASELLRLIEVEASCFNHYCVGCDVTQLNVLHNVHRRISLG